MLKREDVLKELGITEEQVTEMGINVTNLLKLAQAKGDELATSKAKEIEELKKAQSEKNKAPEEPKASNTEFSMEQVQKMIQDAIGGVKEETKKKEEERLTKEFIDKATKKGYTKEQVEYFTNVTKVDALNDFNFSMFPLKEEEEFGNKSKQDGGGSLSEEQEMLKMLGL